MRLARLLPAAGLLGLLLAAPLSAQVVFQPVPGGPPVPADPPGSGTKPDPKKAEPATQEERDKAALEGAGLKADAAAGLVQFLKARTVPDADRAKIEALIGKMNAEAAFDDRLAAQQELLKMGGPAVGSLKMAAKENKDPEVAYRARECVRLMEKDKLNNSEVTLAVVRALAKANTADSAAALFAFLPLADTPQLVDAIQAAMTAAAGKDGKPAQLLVDGLADANVARRQVAAVALLSGGTAEKRVRFPDVYPKVVALAKADPDSNLKFAVAKVLLVGCREKEAVPLMCDLMPTMTRGQSWQAEELLAQLAGKDAPKERCKHTRDASGREVSSNKGAREKCRDAWKKWWEGATVDLAKADLKPTLKGELYVVSSSWSGQQQGIVTEYGADDKEKTRIAFTANSLSDAVIRDDGKILTLDYNQGEVQVRDATGKVLVGHKVPQDKNVKNFGFQPKNLQLLADGGVMVFHANGYSELDKDGKAVQTYTRPEVNKGQPSFDVAGGVRLTDGRTVLSLTGSKLVVVDDKGKETDKKITTGQPNHRATLVQTGDDKVLVPEQSRLIEYDLKTGKAEGFKVDNIYNAVHAQKMPNGNVLYTDTNQYPPRIVEKSPSGEEVWSLPTRDQNAQILRAMVR